MQGRSAALRVETLYQIEGESTPDALISQPIESTDCVNSSIHCMIFEDLSRPLRGLAGRLSGFFIPGFNPT
jgi:hypothetical protein